MAKQITLLASGTRGDVQPFVALALALKARGLDVRVATHANFRPLVERHGLACMLIEGNPSELMMQQGGRGALAIQGGWLRSARATSRFLSAARPVYAGMLSSGWLACQGSDALIIGLPTIWGMQIAEALEIPCCWCPLQPLSRTAEFPSSLLPFTRSLGRIGNRLTHRLIEQALWLPWRSVINRWRREELHASPIGIASPYAEIEHALVLYGFSRQVVPRPHDWPSNHIISGYWFLDDAQSWTPPTELMRFLDAGDSPVYIGFGSPGVRTATSLQTITEALEALQLRAIVNDHSLVLRGGSANPRVFHLADAPHSWLFAHVAAVVHHGGAGTMAASLRAGAPMVVLPGATDQFFWAARAAALGVAPAAIPQSSLNTARLITALDQATRSHYMRLAAQKLSRLLQDEDGAGRAAGIIKRLMTGDK
jgi:sterol 3beta-glucosyltransferase